MAESVSIGVSDGELEGSKGGSSELQANGGVVGRDGVGGLVVEVPEDGDRGGGSGIGNGS